MTKYIIISPVRNEEKYIAKAIKAVINQNIKPLEWIIVNDGSTDSTKTLIEEYIINYPWIRLINLDDRGYYYPGTGVVNVIKKGFENISRNEWDYLVKLDCDISLDNNYFENIFNEFKKNPKLGIASGAVYFVENNTEVKEKSQNDHPWGASKIYLRNCFEDINGWKPIPGWDLADLLAAQMKGWDTRCFDQYKIYHYRKTGTRRTDITKGMFLLGRFHYRYGYGIFYTFMKSIYRITEKPIIIGGISIFLGYLYGFITQENRLFDIEMRKFLRKKQKVYVIQKLKRIFNK